MTMEATSLTSSWTTKKSSKFIKGAGSSKCWPTGLIDYQNSWKIRFLDFSLQLLNVTVTTNEPCYPEPAVKTICWNVLTGDLRVKLLLTRTHTPFTPLTHRLFLPGFKNQSRGIKERKRERKGQDGWQSAEIDPVWKPKMIFLWCGRCTHPERLLWDGEGEYICRLYAFFIYFFFFNCGVGGRERWNLMRGGHITGTQTRGRRTLCFLVF